MSAPQRTNGRIACAAIALLAVLPCQLLQGDGGPVAAGPSAAATRLRYRRIYVPQDDLRAETRGLLPLRREEFEKRIADSQRLASPTLFRQPRITTAEYHARLDGQQLVAGEARLAVDFPGEGEGLLELEKCNLALGKIAWEAAPSVPAAPAAAGTTAEGKSIIVVERAGRLLAAWTLRGERDPEKRLHFDLSLPPASVSRLILQLPRGLQLAAKPGKVSSSDAPQGETTWSVELGGNLRCQLTVTEAGSTSPRQNALFVRESSRYGVSLADLSVETTFQLDAPADPLAALTLQLDPRLHLTKIRLGEQTLEWTVLAGAPASQVAVRLPEPLVGIGRTLTVNAVTALPSEESWKIPRIQLVGGIWQEGAITLVSAPDLHLAIVDSTGSRQTAAAPPTPAEPNEIFQFQCFSPAVEITVRGAAPAPRLQVRSGLTLAVEGAKWSGVQQADVSSLDGEQFLLEGEVARAWIVDAVETVPADALLEFSSRPLGVDQNALSLRLRRPLKERRELRVIVRAHLSLLPQSTPLNAEMCALCRFRFAAESRTIVALQTFGAGLQPELQSDLNLVRLDANQLSADDRRLFASPPQGVVFLLDRAASDLRLLARESAPRYSAASEVQADVCRGKLDLVLRVNCFPESGAVGRVAVRVSPPLSESTTWTMADQGDQSLIARRIEPGKGLSAIAGANEFWEIELLRPRSAPFELRAQMTLPFSQACSLPLVSLPRSLTQSGQVQLRVEDGCPVRIQTEGLENLPLATQDARDVPAVRAQYRYEPGRYAVIRLSPADTSRSLPSLFVKQMLVESRFLTDGSGRHTVTALLESSGEPRLRFHLPLNVNVQQVTVGASEPLSLDRQGDGSSDVPLPPTDRFSLVRITYATLPQPLAWHGAGRWTTPLPKFNVPTLERKWRCWLPPGCEWFGWRPAKTAPVNRLAGWPEISPLPTPDEWVSAGIASANPSSGGPDNSTVEFVQELWRQVCSPERITPADRTSWADLFSALEQRLASAPRMVAPRLFLDVPALELAGVLPTAPAWGDTADDDGETLLRRKGLVLLVSPSGLLATTATEAILRGAISSSAPTYPVILAAPPDWEPYITSEMTAGAGYCRPDEWEARRFTATTSENRFLASYGVWTPREPPLRADESATILVYQPRYVQFAALALVLASAGICVASAGKFGRLKFFGTCIAAFAAFVLPREFAPLAAAGVWGMMLGIGVLSLRPWSRAMRPDAIASALLAILLPFVGGRVDSSGDSRLSGAAAAADPPAAPPQELYRVVIPVDEKQRPVGDYVYVSRGLYDGLLQQSLQSQRFPDQLLRSANYTLQFAWNKEAKRLELEEVAAQWELETKRDEMSVRIPIRRDQLHLLPERARLDGQPIKVDWSAVGDALLAPVEKRGVYRLELAWTASPKLRDDWMELTLAIPAVARSQLKTRLAPDAPPITYPSALGAISALPAEDAVVELGPTNQLALRWPTEARRSRSVVNLEAEQFLWWKVRPGSVVVEGRFLFRPVQGALTEAQLTVDPRWRLLPLAPAPEIERVWTEDGALTTLHFLLREPTSKPLEIRADFQLPQAAGIGQLVAPTLAAAANRLTTNWSAVSVPNDYEMDTSREPESLPLAPEEFLRRWGAAPQIPAAAFDLSTAAAAPLTFSVRPRNFQAVCDQTADYSFRRDSISLHYQAELSASPPHQFHRQARIPTGFRVSRVTLTAEGAPVKLRWLQAADDVLRIDLFQPPPPRQLLEIEAESTSGLLGKCTLPDIHLSDVATRTSRLRIYRAADAQVQLLNLEGFSESPPAGADEQPSRGRLTNVLLSAAAKGKTPAAVTLEHSSNQPDARVRLITLIREEHPTWFAEVECRLQVQGGVLDAFRLEIPAEWVGPLEVFPTMEQRLIVIPGQSRRHLLLTPPQPWAGEARVVIRGPLRTSGGGAFRVPDVVPLDFTIADRLIVVPRQSGERALAWETAGLQNTAIPPSPLTTPLPRDSFEAFQVVAPHFEAALASTSSAVGVLKLNQAQALIHWKGDSSYWGTADFSIEPSGQDELTIQMPEGSELVQASLAGIPAAAVRLGEYSWKISLAPEAYPQLLRLCFVGRCPAATAQARDCIWQLPRIVGLPAQRILWTVAAPPEVAGRFGATQAARLSPLEFSSGEMQAVINSVQVAAAGGALNRRPDQAEAWLSFWARRFAVCRRNAYGRIGDGSSPALPPEREIKLREEEFGAATANLTPDVPLDLESLARSAAEPGPPIVGQVVPTYWQSRTLDNSLTLSLAALPRPTEIPQWLLAILVFGGLLLAGYFALGNHHVEQWAAAYPGFACFLGIAAICCLTPATWLGWIAAVTVLIAALSRPWPARNLEPVSTRTLGLQNGLQKT